MPIIDKSRIEDIQNDINGDYRDGGSYYELTDILGAGGMGAVFLARFEPLGVLRALKVLCVDEQATPSDIKAAGDRFLREARIMGKLRHPAAIKALDYQVHYCTRCIQKDGKEIIEKASIPYLIYAMEPCLVGDEEQLRGICRNYGVAHTDTLEQKLEQERKEGHGSISLQTFLDAGYTFPEKTVARFARELIAVLRSAHEQEFEIEGRIVQGVVHRDVKPSNILVGPDGRLRLTDFGISKTTSDWANEKNGSLSTQIGSTGSKGTPAYAAPEQWSRDVASVSREADYYSLGVVLYQLLTGCPQDDLKSDTSSAWKAPLTRVDGISRHWDILLCGMLIPYPDMRIANPDLLDYEFGEIEAGRG